MSVIRIAVLSLFSSGIFAQPFEDGVYELSAQETGQSIISEDGTRHWPGERLAVTFYENSIVALDNSNERFQITLRYPSETPPDFSFESMLTSSNLSSLFPSLVLIVDGVPHISRGAARGNGRATVFMYVSGAENAERVAEYFGTDVIYRYHPGHQLLIKFSPQEQTVQLGNEVTVALQITNIGDTSFRFHFGARLPFRFSAIREGESVRRTGWPLRANDLASFPTVRPGETRRIEVNVANWLVFDEPGLYYVFGAYRMEFLVVDLAGEPRTIWSEYLSADFSVTVEE